MRPRVDIRIHPHGHRRNLRQQTRARFDPVEFLDALEVEAPDTGLDGEIDLGDGLADAGKDDPLGIAAREQHAFEFSARNDVEPGAKVSHQPEDGEIAVGLHGIADAGMAERPSQALEPLLDRRPGIDVRRRAHRIGDVGQADVFNLEYVVGSTEHATTCARSSGRYSGPF